MAKKPISRIQKGEGKAFTKAIKMVKSEKTGAYIFTEAMMSPDDVSDWLKAQK